MKKPFLNATIVIFGSANMTQGYLDLFRLLSIWHLEILKTIVLGQDSRGTHKMLKKKVPNFSIFDRNSQFPNLGYHMFNHIKNSQFPNLGYHMFNHIKMICLKMWFYMLNHTFKILNNRKKIIHIKFLISICEGDQNCYQTFAI